MGGAPTHVTIATRTHAGRRPYNQDVVVAETITLKGGEKGYLLIVADGMGGAAAGDIASKVAAGALRDAIVEWLKGNGVDESGVHAAFRLGYRAAHEAVQLEASKDVRRQGMGTTLVSAFVWGNRYVVANVGDSRAYVIDSGDITQITKDHSAVQEMIDRGIIQPEHRASAPMAHALTRAVGDSPEPPEVDIFPQEGSYALRPGQVLLLCSDGLENGVDDDTVHAFVCGIPKLDDAAEALIRAAWHGGSKDNISVVLLECGRLVRRPRAIPVPPPIGRSPVMTRRRHPSPLLAIGLFILAAGLGTATWRVWQSSRAERLPSPPSSKGDEGEPPSAVTVGAVPEITTPPLDSTPQGNSTVGIPPSVSSPGAPPPLAKGDRGGLPSPTSQEDRPRSRRAQEMTTRRPASKHQAPTRAPTTDSASASAAGTVVTEPTRTPPLSSEGDEGTTQPSPPSSKGDEGGFPPLPPEAVPPEESAVEPPTVPAPLPPDSVAPAPLDSPSTPSSADSARATPPDSTQALPETEPSSTSNPAP